METSMFIIIVYLFSILFQFMFSFSYDLQDLRR